MNYFGRVISVIIGMNDQFSIPLLVNSSNYAISVVMNIECFASWESVNDMQVTGIANNCQHEFWLINLSPFSRFWFIVLWKTLLLPVDDAVEPRLTI
jgi:hypothetical protein